MDTTHDFGLEYQTGLILDDDERDESIVKTALDLAKSRSEKKNTNPQLLPPRVLKVLRALRDSNPHLQKKLNYQNKSSNDKYVSYWNRRQRILEFQERNEDERNASIELKVNLGGLMVRVCNLVPFIRSSTHENVSLTFINLGGTDISMKNLLVGFKELPFSRLTSLHLGGCGIGSQENGVQDLIHVLKFCQRSLNSLDLRYNDMCGTDMTKLRKVLSESTVEILHLEGNSIGCHGATAIGMLLSKSKFLKELYIGSNGIGSNGAKQLAMGLKGSNLRKLYVEGNSIGDEGAEKFEAVLTEQAKHNCKLLENMYFENNGVNKGRAMSLGRALGSESMINGTIF